jgi:ADP-heptose:LPS heptosyltransferase
MKRILIVHTWGIGDWLFFTPALGRLKEACPDAVMDVILGTPGTAGIVELYPEVNIRAVADVRKRPWMMLVEAVKTWPARYDALIFTAGIDSAKADGLAAFIKAGKKAALSTNGHRPRFIDIFAAYDPDESRINNNLKLLGLLGIQPPSDARPYLRVGQSGLKPLPKSILIHPGSDAANSFKRWPAGRFAQVAEWALGVGAVVSVILGPDEVELAGSFSRLEGRTGFRLYSGLSLREAIDIISQHGVFFNSDSGLAHIASALGVRTVTIFGPADPRMVYTGGSGGIMVKTSKKPDCMPCMRPGGRYGCAGRECVESVTVEQVTAALAAALG